MFNKLTFYLESCESGSMVEDMSIPGVYLISASTTEESSWAASCSYSCTQEESDCVNG